MRRRGDVECVILLSVSYLLFVFLPFGVLPFMVSTSLENNLRDICTAITIPLLPLNMLLTIPFLMGILLLSLIDCYLGILLFIAWIVIPIPILLFQLLFGMKLNCPFSNMIWREVGGREWGQEGYQDISWIETFSPLIFIFSSLFSHMLLISIDLVISFPQWIKRPS